MSTDEKRGRPADPKKSRRATDPKQGGKRKAPEPSRADQRRKEHRATAKPVETTMKLGRSLKVGGGYVVRLSKRAYKDFNDYTHTGTIDSFRNRKPNKPKRTPSISRNMRFALFLAAIAVVVWIAMMILNNASVSVEKRTISVVGLPKDMEGYTFLHLSDLHGRSFGDKQASLLRTVNGLSYNAVLCTGDMVGRGGNAQPFYDLLEGLTAQRNVYFIPGDSDPPALRTEAREDAETLSQMVLADWVLGAQARGATYVSTTTGVSVGNTTYWLTPTSLLNLNIRETLADMQDQVEQETEGVLYGVNVDRASLPFSDYRRSQMATLDNTVRQMKAEDMHIALSHIPPDEDFLSVAQQRTRAEYDEYAYLPAVDFVFAGHYCGGGWKLPLIGAFYIPNTLLPLHGWFPAQEDVDGFKMIGATPLYTSPGLSITDKIYLPNFRLFNNPTVTLITMTSAITEDLLG